jgi:hypothetical protein
MRQSILVFVGCGAFGCSGQFVDGQTFDVPIAKVVVDGGRGDVHIADGFVTRVEWYASGMLAHPEIDARVEGEVLYVSGSCTGVVGCQVDQWIEAPEGADIEVRMEEGELTLHEAEGVVDVSVERGDVFGWMLQASSVSVRVVEGEVELELLDPAERLEVEVDVGDIDLMVPAGRYAMEVYGDEIRTDDVSIDPDVPWSIRAVAWNGAVHVLGQ